MLAAVQPAAFLDARIPESAGTRDPTSMTREQIVDFQASVVETRSGGTALNKLKRLRQFFGWLLEEGEIEVADGGCAAVLDGREAGRAGADDPGF